MMNKTITTITTFFLFFFFFPVYSIYYSSYIQYVKQCSLHSTVSSNLADALHTIYLKYFPLIKESMKTEIKRITTEDTKFLITIIYSKSNLEESEQNKISHKASTINLKGEQLFAYRP